MAVEGAAEIRQTLKAKGITSRQVSVTGKHGSINLRVKDFSLDLDALKEIAKPHESVRFCEITQEPLLGGNTYVFVSYDYEAQKVLEETDEFKSLLTYVKGKLSEIEGNRGVELAPGFVIFKSQGNGYQASIEWENKNWTLFYNVSDIAFSLYVSKAQGKTNF